MPKTSEMRGEGKFIGKDDVGRGALLTIAGCVKKNTAQEGAPPEQKWCLLFHEIEKPLVLNVTNTQTCELILGSDNTDDWIGKRIVLYVDPTVMYAGKVQGGIRVRAPKPTAPAPVVVASPVTEDDIPF
jgi:hypothetical protein